MKCINNKKGVFYLEWMFSVFILLNIFVLLTQIFYNINNINHNYYDINVLQYETMVTRIELDLKEMDPDSLIVGINTIQFTKKNLNYKYTLIGSRFGLIVGSYDSIIYYMNDIKSVSFTRVNNLIFIKFININSQMYETKIIFSS